MRRMVSGLAGRGAALWLAGCVLVFGVVSLRWPLVGDASYMHYVVFLMRHGMAPYRDIVEMNLPGSYMVESAVMTLLGPDSAGWRIYDLLLMGIAAAAILSLLKPRGRVAGVVAASLFLLVHGQDGVIMSGERDFAVAVLLLAAVAIIFSAFRRARGGNGPLIAAGVLLGVAVTIKPTTIPFDVCVFAWTIAEVRRRGARGWGLAAGLAALLAGMLMPLITVLGFLVRQGAVLAFVRAARGLIRYHASLGHKSLSFLLGHSLSPIVPLAVIWLAGRIVLWRTGRRSNREEMATGMFALAGLCSYLLQRKGFAYQRYPFMGFMLLLIATDLERLRAERRAGQWVGIAGLVTGAVLGTIFVLRIASFERRPPERPLLHDLATLGIRQGQVQCLDTAGSCIADLYAGRIVQSTGFIYDCYLLDGANPVAADLRSRFWAQMARNPPRAIVVTNSVCFDMAPSFEKFDRWPEFERYLNANYTLGRESDRQAPVHYWSRTVTPFGYRIYLRR